MNFNNGFPKKFASMELEKFSGYNFGLNELEPDFRVYANIVAECYVISETKRYYSDGTSKMFYEVVYTWKKNLDGKLLKQIPEFNLNSQCFNSVIVEEIFDNIQEAKDYTRAKNEELIVKNATIYPITEYVAKRKEFEEELKQAYQLETEQLPQKTKVIKLF